MNPIVSIALQIIGYLVGHKAQIKQAIKDIEDLVPDAPGSSKAAVVKAAIATGMGVEDKIESAWPIVAPIFNSFVAKTKAEPVAPAQAAG